MSYGWAALSRTTSKNHKPSRGRPPKNGVWEVTRETVGYSATNTMTKIKLYTIVEGDTFWFEKNITGDCPNYVALELKELNEKLGLIFYLDKVKLYDGRGTENEPDERVGKKHSVR